MICLPGTLVGFNALNGVVPAIAILLLIGCIIAVYIIFSLRKKLNDLQAENTETERINHSLHERSGELKKLLEEAEDSLKDKVKSLKFFRSLAESADDGISFYDREGNLKYSNSAFFRLTGLDSYSYNATALASLIHPEKKDYYDEKLRHLNEKGHHESELRFLQKDGSYLCLSTRSVVIRDENGETEGFLTVSRDITKLRKEHEDLIKANLEAETSIKLKSAFLANISHEIRTPLNSVVGFANLLLSEDISKDVREEYYDHITYNSEKLLQIIGDIIDLSRLESSQIRISNEEVPVGRVVKEVIEEAKQVIRRNEKNINLNVITRLDEKTDRILSDRVWLKRVLNHLMDNAIKFTLDGTVELSYYTQNGDLFFRVKDTGIGINKENLARIFEEFQQEIDGHHRPFEGLGIGLTLVREVIHRMGGKIIVQSEKGVGSVFTFSIPYIRTGGCEPASADTEKLQPEETDIDWSSNKCLLVDDNIDVLTYLKTILVDTGINVVTASSGASAIETIRNTPDLDLILLDLQMPEINGLDVTREIRKISSSLPIIAQTAYIFEEDKDSILRAGCDACLIKPILKENLITVMSSFIRTKPSSDRT
ncbi:MAG TPA: response regulator [Bacteroidales bacterium]|jgi:PAS domain S-box-containing protein|nr:response regulator [Bacteroidales bacterium]